MPDSLDQETPAGLADPAEQEDCQMHDELDAIMNAAMVMVAADVLGVQASVPELAELLSEFANSPDPAAGPPGPVQLAPADGAPTHAHEELADMASKAGAAFPHNQPTTRDSQTDLRPLICSCIWRIAASPDSFLPPSFPPLPPCVCLHFLLREISS